MPKAKAHPNQLGFTFEAPTTPSRPAALAGMEQRICSTVGTLLNSDPRRGQNRGDPARALC